MNLYCFMVLFKNTNTHNTYIRMHMPPRARLEKRCGIAVTRKA